MQKPVDVKTTCLGDDIKNRLGVAKLLIQYQQAEIEELHSRQQIIVNRFKKHINNELPCDICKKIYTWDVKVCHVDTMYCTNCFLKVCPVCIDHGLESDIVTVEKCRSCPNTFCSKCEPISNLHYCYNRDCQSYNRDTLTYGFICSECYSVLDAFCPDCSTKLK